MRNGPIQRQGFTIVGVAALVVGLVIGCSKDEPPTASPPIGAIPAAGQPGASAGPV
ncbi:MAG: hypothetical protein ACI9OJ_005537, partial [Myxococcota bacterium]